MENCTAIKGLYWPVFIGIRNDHDIYCLSEKAACRIHARPLPMCITFIILEDENVYTAQC